MDGSKFRNTEFFRIADGKIQSVEVYFGSETAGQSTEQEIRALIEATINACALMACYADDVVAFDLITPLHYRSAQEMAKRAAEWFASFEGEIEYGLIDLKITGADEAGFGPSRNRVKGIKVGGGALEMWWRATICCAKIEGEWLITHAHSSVPFDMKTGQATMNLNP